MTIVDPPIPQIVTAQMLVPEDNVFIGAQPGSVLVLHKTAGGSSAEAIAHMFATASDKRSAHFVVGQDGHVIQCVHLVDGAGANCCLESGHDPFWDGLAARFTNLNWCTISIEHVDAATDNSSPLTPAQQQASFTLIKWLVDQYGFDISPDGKGQMKEIKGHNTLDPVDRARCPGEFPWSELMSFLQNPAPSPPQNNPHQDQAMQDCWNSCKAYLQAIPRYDSGIAGAWRAAYTAQKYYGPPLGAEYPSVDWSGTPIIVQEFAHGRCEWVNGSANWYSFNGKES